MAPRTWECVKCKCTILYNQRKQRVGTEGFSSRLTYYARAYGGFWDYSPNDYFCSKCSNKVFDYCKKNGSLEEIRRNKEMSQLDRQNHLNSVEISEGQETQQEPQERSVDSQEHIDACSETSTGALSRDDSLMEEGDSDPLLINDDSENTMQPADESISERIDREDSEPIEAGQNNDFDFGEGQSVEMNSEAYSINSNVEICYSEASFNSEPLPMNRTSRKNVATNFPKIVSLPKTMNQCIICKGKSSECRRAIPEPVRMKVWIEEYIFIPSISRCCRTHYDDGKFTPEALAKIREKGRLNVRLDVTDTTNLIVYLTKQVNEKKSFVNFDDPLTKEDIYKDILGMEKTNFDHLFVNYIEKEPTLLKSKNRSKRNALAIFLAKMRLGASQKFLGQLFGIKSQSIICTTIKRIAIVLNQSFLPHAEGYSHISREEILSRHQPEFVRKLFEVPDGKIVTSLDATYLDINKPSDFDLQQKTYCLHKKKNLVKPMMVVCPDGYIICADGPYFSDGKHNDARMLSDMLDRPNSILTLIESGDHMLKDRGFRDVEGKLTQLGITFSAPEHLEKNQKQFSTEQANNSRKVTLCRWVVESAHGRAKNVFPFFAHKIPNAYLGRLQIPVDVKNHEICQLGVMWKIACGIMNKYHPPLFTETEKHQRILELFNSRSDMANLLASKIAELDLKKRRNWESISETDLTEFPMLSTEDIEVMTLGSYQLRNTQGYTDLIRKNNPSYRLEIFKEDHNLLLARVPSRYRQRIIHHAYVGFDNARSGPYAITGYSCSCQVGNINVSMCSHTTAVIWYLSYERHQPSHKRKRSFAANLLSAAETSLRVDNPNLDDEDEDIDVEFDEED